ncbi:MAG: hypothetical protein H3C36_02200 [Chitinophagaceae bacterium]|nr:hypothetical protein [Chitinophagaceae bacterium]
MTEYMLQHLSEFLTGIIAVIVGWMAKSKTTKKTEEADLTKLIQDIYGKMIEDTNRQLDQNTAEIAELKKNLADQEAYWQTKLAEVDKKWQNKYSTLQKQNTELKKRITELENNEGNRTK